MAMGSSDLQRFNMAEIYAAYFDIASRNDYKSSRELSNILSKSLEARGLTRDTIFNELLKLMSLLDLSGDSHQFNCFYNFVFFIFREKGQKNISVCRAISAWRVLLTGRFQLLNQWCNFVEKHQKHNITEDTWQQLLAFSQYVNDDLERYDPKDAWPYLIDDFVEHIYSTRGVCCNYEGNKTQPGISSICRGLNSIPRAKRKLLCVRSDYMMRPKHCKPRCLDSDVAMSGVESTAGFHADANRNRLLGGIQTSACAVEDSLSTGFEGHISVGSCFQFDQKRRVSYTWMK